MGWVTKNTPPSLRTGWFYDGNGREIALHRIEGQPAKRQAHHRMSWYSENVKVEAATLWAVTRNVEKVHTITKVPRYQIKKWMKEIWWDNVVKQCRKEQNELLDIKLTEVIATAVDVIQDRLREGEVYVDRKTKEEYRVPVNVKSASIALETTFKERQLIRGEATNRTESISQDQKLEKLKEQFERLAMSKQINPKSEPIEEIEYEPVQETGEETTAGADSEYLPEESSEDSSPIENQGEEVIETSVTFVR